MLFRMARNRRKWSGLTIRDRGHLRIDVFKILISLQWKKTNWIKLVIKQFRPGSVGPQKIEVVGYIYKLFVDDQPIWNYEAMKHFVDQTSHTSNRPGGVP